MSCFQLHHIYPANWYVEFTVLPGIGPRQFYGIGMGQAALPGTKPLPSATTHGIRPPPLRLVLFPSNLHDLIKVVWNRATFALTTCLELGLQALPRQHALNHVSPVQAVDAVCPEDSLLDGHHRVTYHHEIPGIRF